MLAILAKQDRIMKPNHWSTKLIVAIAFFRVLCTPVGAQHTYASFQHEEDIVKKAEAGLYLWNEYLRNDLDSLKIMAVELMLAAAEEKNAFAKAVGESSLGSYQIRTGEIEQGIEHLNSSRRFFSKREDYDQLSINYNELGNAYYLLGKYHDAIKMYLSSLRYGALAPDPTSAFNAKIGLGRSYCATGDTAVAVHTILKYKDEAAKFRKFEAVADAYAYLGEVEMERNPDLSREYYEKSILFSGKSNSRAHLSHAYNNMAILHFNLGELDSSLFYFEKALSIRKKINHQKGLIESYYNIGYYYKETRDYHNAYINFSKSMDFAKKNGFSGDEYDALMEMKELCETLGFKKEFAEIETRMGELDKELEKKKSADKDIIAYAEKTIREAGVLTDNPVDSKDSSSMYLWILGGALVLLLTIGWLRRRKAH